jgi:hypothetical protein
MLSTPSKTSSPDHFLVFEGSDRGHMCKLTRALREHPARMRKRLLMKLYYSRARRQHSRIVSPDPHKQGELEVSPRSRLATKRRSLDRARQSLGFDRLYCYQPKARKPKHTDRRLRVGSKIYCAPPELPRVGVLS